MRIRTQGLKSGDRMNNHSATLRVRSARRAGGFTANHSEALQIRSQVTAVGFSSKHNEALQVRTALKAGGVSINHNEGLVVRSALKAGGPYIDHNQMIRQKPDRRVVSIRDPLCPKRRQEDRLELMIVQPVPRMEVVRRQKPSYTNF